MDLLRGTLDTLIPGARDAAHVVAVEMGTDDRIDRFGEEPEPLHRDQRGGSALARGKHFALPTQPRDAENQSSRALETPSRMERRKR